MKLTDLPEEMQMGTQSSPALTGLQPPSLMTSMLPKKHLECASSKQEKTRGSFLNDVIHFTVFLHLHFLNEELHVLDVYYSFLM